jgi:hypothetical protein
VARRLLSHGEWGRECQLSRDGAFYGGRRFELRAQAIEQAAELKIDLKEGGWEGTKGDA